MMDPGLMKGLIALVTMATFLGICWWAYRPSSRDRFEQDGLLAFDDDELRSSGARSPESEVLRKPTEIDA